MMNKSKPIANKNIVLREESNNWALLFDLETGNTFGVDPVGVFIWKHLDGNHSTNEIVVKLKENFNNVPDNANKYINDFLHDLINNGMIGIDDN